MRQVTAMIISSAMGSALTLTVATTFLSKSILRSKRSESVRLLTHPSGLPWTRPVRIIGRNYAYLIFRHFPRIRGVSFSLENQTRRVDSEEN